MHTRMKLLVLSLLLLTQCACSQVAVTPPVRSSQEVAPPPTKLEAFLGKRGRLLVKDSYALSPISRLGKVEMDALVIYEPGSTEKTKGLRVEVTESGRLERSSTSFIDLDELRGLSDALTYMINLAAKWSGQSHSPYTEIIYASKGELSAGFYQKGTESSAFVRSGRIGSATAFLQIPDLQMLKTEVDEAITTLNSK